MSIDINNLDLTKNYVYVLELEDNRYYIGRTSNIVQRMQEHFNGNGSVYTSKFKPIKIVEVNEELTLEDERNKTLEYMELYDWKKVRGYVWCKEHLLKKPDKEKEYKPINKKIFYDNEIRNLYTNENKNIIEISEILNKSPGLIAVSLEHMDIVDRRQLSRGYLDYVFSDLYQKNKEVRKIRKEEYKIIKKEKKVALSTEQNFDKQKIKNISKNILSERDINEIKIKICKHFDIK
jgi:predicted GIY-YIG superfamily endonuclease